MIISRSPLRISLGGGGTDLASYYSRFEGFLIAAAIDKYVYVTVTRPFSPGLFLKYSALEKAVTVDDIRHPIIREAIRIFAPKETHLEITTMADIPAGTGLGSSGSFGTALIQSLSLYYRAGLSPREIAEMACKIEIELLKEPIGKQDQYISCFGGVTCFSFHRNDSVTVKPLESSEKTLIELEENLVMFFTGFSREAGTVLSDQNSRTQASDAAMLENLHYVKQLGQRSKQLLEQGATVDFGALMHEHWLNKKRRSSGMSNSLIDEWYETGRRNGAVGGKLVGAGGGGFLLFYCEDRRKLRAAMTEKGLQEVRFNFDFEGAKIVHA